MRPFRLAGRPRVRAVRRRLPGRRAERIRTAGDGVFSLRLQPVATVIYPVPPERGRDDGLGGVVTLEWISAGRWLTLQFGGAAATRLNIAVLRAR